MESCRFRLKRQLEFPVLTLQLLAIGDHLRLQRSDLTVKLIDPLLQPFRPIPDHGRYGCICAAMGNDGTRCHSVSHTSSTPEATHLVKAGLSWWIFNGAAPIRQSSTQAMCTVNNLVKPMSRQSEGAGGTGSTVVSASTLYGFVK